jgi:hypothetical protein
VPSGAERHEPNSSDVLAMGLPSFSEPACTLLMQAPFSPVRSLAR